jgi:hypothetical protein
MEYGLSGVANLESTTQKKLSTIRISIYPSIYYISIYPSIYQSVCLSIYQAIYRPIYHTYLSMNVSIRLSILSTIYHIYQEDASIYLSIYYVHLSICHMYPIYHIYHESLQISAHKNLPTNPHLPSGTRISFGNCH